MLIREPNSNIWTEVIPCEALTRERVTTIPVVGGESPQQKYGCY